MLHLPRFRTDLANGFRTDLARDVLKVLKLHSPTARAILRTFKTSLVPINHEMHSRSYNSYTCQK